MVRSTHQEERRTSPGQLFFVVGGMDLFTFIGVYPCDETGLNVPSIVPLFDVSSCVLHKDPDDLDPSPTL